MIIWGGCDTSCYNTGAAYDPIGDQWTALTTTDAPAARGAQSAVWASDRMTVWGGCTYRCSSYLNTGGRYLPQVLPTSAAIQGVVWYDVDGDGSLDQQEPGLAGVAIGLWLGGLQIAQMTTAGDGSYGFTLLQPGLYQVTETQPPWLHFSSTPNEATVNLAAGQQAKVDFGDWAGIPTWLPLTVR
jgi:hypothetical protein